ncbi:hypothetical protein UY3_06216 [Chelonia mydas]|uniref:Uncharacterized protein n=1 Tax=Chelonia mydas TaxID=8469 RepID=M7BHB4_CHEMY|nr:hypothetical protein UY3_06216 [Chelonia mydas]
MQRIECATFTQNKMQKDLHIVLPDLLDATLGNLLAESPDTARLHYILRSLESSSQRGRRSFLQTAVLAIHDPLLRVCQAGLLLTYSLLGEAQQLVGDKITNPAVTKVWTQGNAVLRCMCPARYSLVKGSNTALGNGIWAIRKRSWKFSMGRGNGETRWDDVYDWNVSVAGYNSLR